MPDFSRDVLPILSGKCLHCHGPEVRKGGLRLDALEHAVKPAKSGLAAIVPGHANQSELIRRIDADERERMPPLATHKILSEQEKAILRRWVDSGAAYGTHWAFTRVRRSAVPAVTEVAWVANEIDSFILQKLEAASLEPSPRADRTTLIRRLSLDLRGLPPSLEEVDAFLADEAPDAYARLVDRMLASPHFGEKMAQLWMDLARFGDTSGYHQDSVRQMWLWRDWVIDAYNANMPFDRFTIEQLAGDLLPSATQAQKIATGFNRNTRFNEEGGVDPEEYVIRYNVDRTNTLGQVWLGLTLGCAECHGHKYDPISQKEYYQLFAYFTGIKEPMVSENHNQPLPPLLKVPSREQTEALAKARADLDAVQEAIRRQLARIAYVDPGESNPEAGPLESQRAWERKTHKESDLPADVKAALHADAVKRTPAEVALLRSYYLRKVHRSTREDLADFEQEAEALRKTLAGIDKAIPYSLVCEEMDTPRPAHVLIRGDFQQKGERVDRGVPTFLPPLPRDGPNNRLALARWLVSPDHPLTARVQVNRLWAQMFGAGLVRTLGDFGSQGDYPSHPELLDWLARQFTHSGWNVKALLKTMALSNTYQQASTHRVEKADPNNRLLYRAARFRLSAEEIRDHALAVSGLLSRKIGGPSFMPYQPADYYHGKFEEWKWTPSEGEEQYRRGLYAFWRRTCLHPMFGLFDAPIRDECAVTRPRTNTPLQALVTLNAPTFVEAARVFAQNLLIDEAGSSDARLRLAFRRTLSRAPTTQELQVLATQLERQRQRLDADRDAAARLISVGLAARPGNLDVAEHAAWTAVASVLLNLDETLTRE